MLPNGAEVLKLCQQNNKTAMPSNNESLVQNGFFPPASKLQPEDLSTQKQSTADNNHNQHFAQFADF